MLLVTLEMKARPDKRKELLQTLLAWMGPARKTPGCKGCDFYLNTESGDRFILTEDWRTPSDFEQHLQSEDFRVLCGAIRLLCDRKETTFSAFSKTARTEALERSLGILFEEAFVTA